VVAEPSPKITIGKFDFLPTAAMIRGKPPLEEWSEPLLAAIWCQRASPWWIGDLLNAGDARFGEAFSQACQGHVSSEMLQRYESISRRVPRENRRPSLSWSAHAAVARLPYNEQREMLKRAEERGWNSEQLRVKVREWIESQKNQ